MTSVVTTTSEAAAIWFRMVINSGRYDSDSGGRSKVLDDLIMACQTDELQKLYPLEHVRNCTCTHI